MIFYPKNQSVQIEEYGCFTMFPYPISQEQQNIENSRKIQKKMVKNHRNHDSMMIFPRKELSQNLSGAILQQTWGATQPGSWPEKPLPLPPSV